MIRPLRRSDAGCATATAPRCGWWPSKAPSRSRRTARRSSRTCRKRSARCRSTWASPAGPACIASRILVHTKATTDVLLHGRAHAPQGKPARQVDVMMKVGDLTKVLRVFGDRRWREGLGGLSATDPEPFTTMPIVYERAFGGKDTSAIDPEKHVWDRRNPIGTGFAAEARQLVNQPLPNIEDPRDLVTSWKQRPRPAGFGPIARDWSPRLELSGTYDEAWHDERRPLLPVDFDERFHQSAPIDQQTERYLRGGEAVELFHLTASGYLRFTLPRVAIGFVTRIAGHLTGHPARLHTVLIEPEHPRVTMVWHTKLACHHDVHALEWTRVFQKKRIGRRAGTTPPAVGS
ncbi:MAG: DUF2169 domain-containing protein [Minicystis sp.]